MSLLGIEFPYTSDWVYETSEDISIAIFASVSFGTIILKNQFSDQRMRIKYRCVSVGSGKGLPVNYSRSSFDNSSGAFGAVVSDRYFDDLSFPCRGYIFGAGGGGLVTDGSTPNSGNISIILFGIMPVFAGTRVWGTSGALLPGVGMSAGIASFWIE